MSISGPYEFTKVYTKPSTSDKLSEFEKAIYELKRVGWMPTAQKLDALVVVMREEKENIKANSVFLALENFAETVVIDSQKIVIPQTSGALTKLYISMRNLGIAIDKEGHKEIGKALMGIAEAAHALSQTAHIRLHHTKPTDQRTLLRSRSKVAIPHQTIDSIIAENIHYARNKIMNTLNNLVP